MRPTIKERTLMANIIGGGEYAEKINAFSCRHVKLDQSTGYVTVPANTPLINPDEPEIIYQPQAWNFKLASNAKAAWAKIESRLIYNTTHGVSLDHVMVGIEKHPRSQLYGGINKNTPWTWLLIMCIIAIIIVVICIVCRHHKDTINEDKGSSYNEDN
jgi:hypothetical protein